MYRDRRERLVSTLKHQGRITLPAVEQAFLSVPREVFLPDALKDQAYVDTPLEIGHGQTISAPHMVAIMCEALDIHFHQTILEIGAGSGYHAAIVAHMVETTGRVYTIERHASLANQAKENLKRAGVTNVLVEQGDGSEGLPQYAPYDRIYVTCASPDIPQPLIDQLVDGGKLLIPVGRMVCTLKRIEKKGAAIAETDLGGCAFVPLVGKHGF
ncbi:MAG: protein-L-isoaspartate(D-aspartate) O-methyltransferase [Candidatus Thermoplasmatota archaeon]|nr:protein-L-isoaspartate(D-aspartate) O-methyltransferase [Candidatus Thermoplasmatota archaeon]